MEFLAFIEVKYVMSREQAWRLTIGNILLEVIKNLWNNKIFWKAYWKIKDVYYNSRIPSKKISRKHDKNINSIDKIHTKKPTWSTTNNPQKGKKKEKQKNKSQTRQIKIRKQDYIFKPILISDFIKCKWPKYLYKDRDWQTK